MTERRLKLQMRSSDEGRPHIDVSFDMDVDEIIMVLTATNLPDQVTLGGTLRDIADTLAPVDAPMEKLTEFAQKSRPRFNPRPAGFAPRKQD